MNKMERIINGEDFNSSRTMLKSWTPLRWSNRGSHRWRRM